MSFFESADQFSAQTLLKCPLYVRRSLILLVVGASELFGEKGRKTVDFMIDKVQRVNASLGFFAEADLLSLCGKSAENQRVVHKIYKWAVFMPLDQVTGWLRQEISNAEREALNRFSGVFIETLHALLRSGEGPGG